MAGQGLWRRVAAANFPPALGDYPPAYTIWVGRMKNLGGEISTLPKDPKPLLINGRTYPRVAAAFRDPLKWGPLVNAKTLPIPTAYTTDGRTAYFLAPDDVQQAFARGTDTASQHSADAATPTLLDSWGYKGPDLAALVKPVVIVGGVLAGAYAINAVMSLAPRRNPPRRSRSRRRSR